MFGNWKKNEKTAAKWGVIRINGGLSKRDRLWFYTRWVILSFVRCLFFFFFFLTLSFWKTWFFFFFGNNRVSVEWSMLDRSQVFTSVMYRQWYLSCFRFPGQYCSFVNTNVWISLKFVVLPFLEWTWIYQCKPHRVVFPNTCQHDSIPHWKTD